MNDQTMTDIATTDTTALDDIGLGVAGEAEEVEIDALAAGVFEPPSKQSRLEVLRMLGSRMREARELCSLSQAAAAKRLGYAAPKLAKVESATDTNSVPLWLIRKAAEVYEVSVDFLFGVTDDWECGARMTQEREVSAWLAKAWNDARARDLLAMMKLEAKIDSIREGVVASITAAREANAALDRFSELNPEFAEDMRGGNRLARAVEGVAIAADKANAKLVKMRFLPGAAL